MSESPSPESMVISDGYSSPVWVDISQIKLEPAILMRAEVDDEAIEQYVEDFDDLPPIKVIADRAGKHWLVDGSYRLRAAMRKKKKEVSCLVKAGTYLDAFAEACHANRGHGVRVTNADKRRRVEAAIGIPEHADMSNYQLSKLCGVSHSTVDRIRPDVAQSAASPKKDTLGRKITPKKKAEPKPGANGKPKPAPAPEPTPEELDDIADRLLAHARRTTNGHVPLPGQTTLIDPPPEPEADKESLGADGNSGPEEDTSPPDLDAMWEAREVEVDRWVDTWPGDARVWVAMRLVEYGNHIVDMEGEVVE